MNEVPCFAELAAARRKLGRKQTVQCPICGADTGIEPYRSGRSVSPELRALRERAVRAGMSRKAALFWTTAK